MWKELKSKIQGLIRRFEGVDRWVWSRNAYSVKEAYDSTMEGVVAEDHRRFAIACNGLVPLKVAVLIDTKYDFFKA